MYVAEISPAEQRGRFGSFLPVSLSLGVLMVYALSSFENFRYCDSSLVLIGFVTLYTLSMPFFCETPRWLLSHGYKQRAIAVLKFLRGPKYDIGDELEMIKSKISSTPRLNIRQIAIEFTKGNVFVPMILVLLLVMFLQCGGLNSVISYSALILKSAGVQNFRQIAVYGTGCARLAVNLIAVLLIDFLGRKVLLTLSGIGTFLGTALLGVHFYMTRPSSCLPPMNSTNVSFTVPLLTDGSEIQSDYIVCNAEYAPLVIVAIVIYNVGFSIGSAPVGWTLLGELLPLQVRGVGIGITTFVMWGLTAVVVGTYLSYSAAVQPWFVWWTYSVVNFLSIFFIVFCIFETKGMSLEDIQQKFEAKFGNLNLISSCCLKFKSTC